MTPFEAYQLYLALKNHFTQDSYDFFKYQGKSKAKLSTFERRNDRWYFHRLAKRKNLQDFLLANIIANEQTWVGDLEGKLSDEVYKKWQRTTESLTYRFTEDLKKLLPNFDDNFKVVNHQYPPLLNLMIQGEISFETFAILLDTVECRRYWSRNLNDKSIWPHISKKAAKYLPFLNYDKDKIKKLIVKQFHS